MSRPAVSADMAWMALGLIPGLGPLGVQRLVEAAGSAAAAVTSAESVWLQALGVARGRRCWSGLQQALERAPQQWTAARRHGARPVTRAQRSYPLLLHEIPDPPPVLFVAGGLEPDEASVAIVGSRRASAYGQEVARVLARDLAAEGVVVVSGMAYGVDAAAHRGALEAGGRTIAVLGCGVDLVYPRGHVRLHGEIRARGAVVSELPMGCPPGPGSFPRRNRLISGLSLGVVVIEAPAHSGALITARCACEQNRQVYAVPGSVLDGRNKGGHALLRDGAVLVQGVDDVLAELPQWGLRRVAADAADPQASPLAGEDLRLRRVIEALGPEPVHLSAIAEASGLTPGELLGALLELEIDGRVRQWPGQHFARAVHPGS